VESFRAASVTAFAPRFGPAVGEAEKGGGMGLMPGDETGPVPAGLLDRLAGRPAPGPSDLAGAGAGVPGRPGDGRPGGPDDGRLAADLAVLRDGGYLTLALPARFGGAGLNLAEVACAQRQLAARAPAAAWVLNVHHAWVGAAADALASGDVTDLGPGWVLGQAARGRLFTAEAGPRSPGSPGGEGVLRAGRYAWELALAGMTSYALARRMFELAVARAERAGLSLDRWPVAEASLRLDGMRGQLDEVIASWRQRVAAGGGVTTLDPGRLELIRAFTARHVAADGAERVAALIAGETVAAART
jgi:hypothetical protein